MLNELLKHPKETNIKNIWLVPTVKANIEAIEAIKKANVIIVCPGSMYGSILINFLPEGMTEAYKKSKAKKILMTNISSMANENNGFDQDDYIAVFEKYLSCKSPFDMVLMANLDCLNQKLLNKVLKFYSMEHSFPIKFNKNSKQKTLLVNIAKIEEKNMRLRHSEEKLEKLFKTLEI